ncbi:hypothetical protein FM106_31190 [Brachybacterium faecium]|nr:hypothetical protein FM106_31190 [Brachybacterium faecium]
MLLLACHPFIISENNYVAYFSSIIKQRNLFTLAFNQSIKRFFMFYFSRLLYVIV